MGEPLTLGSLTSLAGRVAWVTGGARGIGRAIAQRLSSVGATTVISDLDGAEAEAAAAAIRAAGGTALALASDARDPAEAARLCEAAVDRFGGLDILVNNAAVYPPGTLLDYAEAQWDVTLDVSLKACFFNSQAAARTMTAVGRGGSIVNLSSTNALRPVGNLSAYAAAKGGVIALTMSLAKELGPLGIRVNAIAPGPIVTPGALAARAAIRETLADYPDSEAPRGVLGRIGHPDDIANAAYFLASDLAAHVTGVTLVVDGGFMLT